ncbi:omega-amidase NIT2-like [Ixodes scapularis]|uniref:omega-amidase NIT2-like n=1 Tax=Ixodes scapularis TaxID=6945 RepID=UPI001A9E7137|nr:omega-amidase NIT2-like [Ixodes scapularis]
MGASKFYLALLQLSLTTNKSENLRKAWMHVKKAASSGAQVICLSPTFGYSVNTLKNLQFCAETIPGETSEMLSSTARTNGIYLVGGSMAEKDNGKMYDTCLVYGPDGSMVAKHRRLNILVVNVPGRQAFRESDYLTPGDHLTTFDTPFCKVAVGLSQEVRFAPLAHIYADLGCKLLVFPGSFNTTLSPLCLDLLQRARAIDNQIYVASVTSARTQDASYGSCGRSMLIDPQGDVVVQSAGPDEAVVMAEVDLEHLSSLRKETPVRKHHRHDLYAVVNRQRSEDDRKFFKNVFSV